VLWSYCKFCSAVFYLAARVDSVTTFDERVVYPMVSFHWMSSSEVTVS